MNNLPSPKSTKSKNRVGRGYGSQYGGHTTGKGTKGQRSRSGYKKPRPGFEGGQNPLSKRLPKLKNIAGGSTRSREFIRSKEVHVPVQLSAVANAFSAKDEVTFDALVEKKLVTQRSHKEVFAKILFDEEISKVITISGVPVSKSAKAAIEKAGGSVNA